MAGKLQNEDFKTEAELTGAGGAKSQLLNDTKIYVTADSINKTLDDAITDGDIGGGGSALLVRDESNTVSDSAVSTIRFPDETVSINAAGDVSIDPTAKVLTNLALKSQYRHLEQTVDNMLNISGELRFDLSSNLDKDIQNGDSLISEVDNAGSTRTEFTANEDCLIQMEAACQHNNANGRIIMYHYRSGVLIARCDGQQIATANFAAECSGIFDMQTGDHIRIVESGSGTLLTGTGTFRLSYSAVQYKKDVVVTPSDSVAPSLVELSSNQSLSTNTYTKIQFDSIVKDDDNNYDETTNHRFTAPSDGYYQINAGIKFSASSGTYSYFARLSKNGSAVYTQQTSNSANAGRGMDLSRNLYLLKDDYIEIFGRQDSGSNKDVEGGAGDTFLDVTRQDRSPLTGVTFPSFQTKYLQSIITGTGVMSDLTFNNLVIGKVYEIKYYRRFASGGTGSNTTAIKNGTTLLERVLVNSTSDNTSDTSNTSIMFTATDTTVTFDESSLNRNVYGDGTAESTKAQIIEYEAGKEVSKF